MNLPTIIGALIIAAVFIAIVARGVYNRKRGQGGCSCGGNCGSCPSGSACHPTKK